MLVLANFTVGQTLLAKHLLLANAVGQTLLQRKGFHEIVSYDTIRGLRIVMKIVAIELKLNQ